MLTDPITLDKLISVAAESVAVNKDTNLRQLILDLKDINPDAIKFATTPWTNLMTTDARVLGAVGRCRRPATVPGVIDDKTDAWLAAHPQGVPSPHRGPT
jgi:hypothetical protein